MLNQEKGNFKMIGNFAASLLTPAPSSALTGQRFRRQPPPLPGWNPGHCRVPGKESRPYSPGLMGLFGPICGLPEGLRQGACLCFA